MRRLIAMGLVVAWVSVAQAQSPAAFGRAQSGVWSSAGEYLWPGPTAVADLPIGGRSIMVASPDGAITTRVTNIELTLVDRNNPARFAQTSIPIASLAEILWAPDSSAFALTQSDGGWVAAWSVRAYRLRSTGLSESDPGRLALADFKQLFSRRRDEYPNVAAVDWLNGSSRLRLVLEMPCHSSCRDMCRVAGYVVNVADGAVIERVPEAAVQREWKAITGLRFRRD